ncbi:DUF2306 domain-containing protein [Paenibacillus sp. N3.4]|uniref:DUF2306 domain-containing protein n=1 Tax=Paenibacillus sp. N3.4 TaxID=2603222 RepID=UPI0011C841B9|nr:DUF2306 domain-containing protein [Paenibacillus sp. N3.4]TXK76014.1 DUF2306 domain-containing protein [Paenibacillus sp. N3.4]
MMNLRRKVVRAWGFGILAFLALAIGAYALVLYGSPNEIREQSYVMAKGSLPDLWYFVLWGHAVSAGVALVIGWLQFVKRLHHQAPNIHRAIGYVYSAMIIIAGLTGIYLAFFANGGWFAQVGFGTLSVLWLYTLFRGLKSIIVERDPTEHSRWMKRNYALTCAAITLRIYIGLAGAFLGLPDTNDTFFVIAWMAWVPNLLIAELMIGERTRMDRRTRVRVR